MTEEEKKEIILKGIYHGDGLDSGFFIDNCTKDDQGNTIHTFKCLEGQFTISHEDFQNPLTFQMAHRKFVLDSLLEFEQKGIRFIGFPNPNR